MANILSAIKWLVGLFGKGSPAPAIPESQAPKPPVEPDGKTGQPVLPAPVAEPVEPEDTAMPRPKLSRGASDKETVKELQNLLNENGERLTVDGDFGGGTATAIRGLRQSYGLPEGETADAAVWAVLDKPRYFKIGRFLKTGLPPSNPVDSGKAVGTAWNKYGNLLAELSEDLGVSPSMACAVLAVESAGEGFWDGQMVIRFENHIFNRWGKKNYDVFKAHFRFNNVEAWKDHAWRPDGGAWRPLHTKTSGQSEEWAALEFARTLDDTAALNSISMGAPQIMGFNSPKIGFDSVQEMFEKFKADERAHVLGLFDFIRSDHRMVRGLRSGDTVLFAGIYNGSGQKEYYGGKIREGVDLATSLGIS